MDYIVQNGCSTCQIITFLNAHIHKFGDSPLIYGTPEYKKFVIDKCGGYVNVELGLMYQDYTPILSLIKAKEIPFKDKIGKNESIKRFIIKQLAQGHLIDFTAYVRGLHSFLIAEYNPKFDSFKCINGRFFSDEPIEWLSYDVITKIGYYGNKSYIRKASEKQNSNAIFKDSSVIVF